MGELPLGEGELLRFHWDPTVRLQAGPVKTYYVWNGTHPIKRGAKVGALVWHILFPVSSHFTVRPPPASCMICTTWPSS